MAINIHHWFKNNTGFNENNCLNNMLDNVSHKFDNALNIISHSKFSNDIDFKEMLQETNSEICILNFNCLNLKTRLDKLKIFLADTDSHSKIACITLQGMCFDEHTDWAFHSMPEYTLISDACLPYKFALWCINIF